MIEDYRTHFRAKSVHAAKCLITRRQPGVPVITYAGKQFPVEQIRATYRLLDYYARFLASDCTACVNPEDRYGEPLTKAQARQRLTFLVNVAINRKAGIPDVAGRKQSSDYQASLWRDCRRVRDNVNRRVVVRQFETAEIRRRFHHLITTEDDE